MVAPPIISQARNGLTSASGTSRRTIRLLPRRSLAHYQQAAAKVPFYGAPRPPISTNTSLKDVSSCAATVAETVQSAGERLWLTWRHAATAVRDPTRADSVAAVGELTGRRALRTMLARMRAHPAGRQILRDRPAVSKATIPHERLLREARELENKNDNNGNTTTFGQAYGTFLLQHGFDPDERDAVHYLDGGADDEREQQDLAYVMLRYRQCHDFWHALTGLPPTVAGELGLKWLELFQTGLPLAALACTAGSGALSNNNDLHAVWNTYLPWARRCHAQMEPMALLNVYYEQEWDTPLDELRQRLRLEPAPVVVEKE